MKETIIFLFLFLAVFGTLLFVFNGRFIYTQIKYFFLGPAPIVTDIQISDKTGDRMSPEFLQIPQRLIIPMLGVDAPIIWPDSVNEKSLQYALEKGVVFWPGSVLPEEKGTIIILGHSSAYPWYKGAYGSVFGLLDRLEKDDEILIYTSQKKYTYIVIDKEINLPENLNIDNQKEQSTLYLLSCWPVRTDWKRIAVKALLLDTK